MYGLQGRVANCFDRSYELRYMSITIFGRIQECINRIFFFEICMHDLSLRECYVPSNGKLCLHVCLTKSTLRTENK